MKILEKYPLPWKIIKVEWMNYYRVESSDNQYIMWGNDIEILELVVKTASNHGDMKKDVTEFWGFDPFPWL